jgi:HAMP domain-containing protein
MASSKAVSNAEVRWQDAKEGILDLFDTAGDPISEATIGLMLDATSWLRDFYDGWRARVKKRLRELESSATKDDQGEWWGRFKVNERLELKKLTEDEVEMLEGELQVLEGEQEHLGEKLWNFEHQTPLEVVEEYLKEVFYKYQAASEFKESEEFLESKRSLLAKFEAGTLTVQDVSEYVLLGGVMEKRDSAESGLSLDPQYAHVFG